MNNISNDNYTKTYYLADKTTTNSESYITFHSRKEEEASELAEFEKFEAEMSPFSVMPLRNRLMMIDSTGKIFNKIT